jgi:phosphoserine aminotransferase
MCTYKVFSDSRSLPNTAPVYPWYMLSKMVSWTLKSGGVEAMDAAAKARSNRLYEFIDSSSYYQNTVDVTCRSRMNIPFLLADEAHNADFLAQSEQAGLLNLKGHRVVGGMRASLYNAMPMAGVDALIDFMSDFEKGR